MTVVARRRGHLAAAAGAGVGRPGRGRRPPPRRGQGRRSRCRPARRLGARSASAPRSCCSWSPRLARAVPAAHFTVFALAIVIGYYVIGNVHHALHTPLMSVTNAISRHHRRRRAAADRPRRRRRSRSLAFVAILLASINVFGGFAVTRRMLAMFREELSPMTIDIRSRRRPTSSRRCCSSSRLAGLSKHETAQHGQHASASPAWPSRSSRPSRLGARPRDVGRRHRPRPADRRRHGHRRRDRPVARHASSR